MKKIIKIIALFFAVVLLGGVVIKLSTPQIVEEAEESYAITYRMVKQNTLYDTEFISLVDERMYKTDGSYPTKYSASKGARISDLDSVEIEAGTVYDFYGWYLDKELTQVFDGRIDPGTEGDITLYAFIIVSYWTPFI